MLLRLNRRQKREAGRERASLLDDVVTGSQQLT